MSKLLRDKMIAALRRLHTRGAFTNFSDFDDPEGFDRLMTHLARHRWHVYAKKPFREALHVLRYLGRYTHRVAISSSRLVAVGDHAVTFHTKDGKTVTVAPVEFLRRFVQHVLPDGLHKIRHYGLYAGALDSELAVARTALGAARPAATTVAATWAELLLTLTGCDVTRCPRCGGQLARVPVPRASARAPPQRAGA